MLPLPLLFVHFFAILGVLWFVQLLWNIAGTHMEARTRSYSILPKIEGFVACDGGGYYVEWYCDATETFCRWYAGRRDDAREYCNKILHEYPNGHPDCEWVGVNTSGYTTDCATATGMYDG